VNICLPLVFIVNLLVLKNVTNDMKKCLIESTVLKANLKERVGRAGAEV
jgi:hypothetical protein